MKKTLAIMLALIMVLALVPTVAFAEEPKTIYVDATKGNDDQEGVGTTSEKAYKSLDKAMKAAVSGDTIYLAAGTYCGNSAKPSEEGEGAKKNLTFVGAGSDKTTWQIRAMENNTSGDGPCDYSFQGSDSITFEKMTVVGSVYPDGITIKANDYQGFVRINHLKLKDCTFNGRADYWGYETTEFENVTFYAPGTTDSGITGTNYSLWTKTGWEYTFDNCTFNASGKVINVYTDYGAGKYDITVNFKNCTVNNTGESLKPVLNINDSNMCDFKYILNITGDNNVTGVDVDKATCSRLFGFGGKAETNNKAKTVVYINDVNVWENGNRIVDHNCTDFKTGSYDNGINVNNTQYTDGYKDNAFTVTPNGPGSFEVKCDYCGYTETSTGGLYNDIELERTVKQGQEIETPNPKDTYKVNGPSGITVDYTATMDMTKLKWLVAGKDVDLNTIPGNTASSPWELLMALAQQIDDRTEVILTFKFDDKIDLKAFKAKYEAAVNAGKPTDVLMLESNMFEIADGGVQFDIENQIENPKREMTIKCNWNWKKEAGLKPDPKITLYGYGLPVEANWGGNKIEITNSGCVGGMVHINPMGEAMEAMAEPARYVAANRVSSTTPSMDNTIRIPIVGGCKTDEFTLYYGGGSSGDSSGGSSSGGYYYPTTTPVPVIVIPPKTGDMTIWQSILHFLGIR